MKKVFGTLFISGVVLLTACKKESTYVCVCTIKETGELSYGDTITSDKLTKQVTEESCKANNDVFAADMESCHLQDL
jgi:hypothetical protein